MDYTPEHGPVPLGNKSVKRVDYCVSGLLISGTNSTNRGDYVYCKIAVLPWDLTKLR